jgi:hypothetical protein
VPPLQHCQLFGRDSSVGSFVTHTRCGHFPPLRPAGDKEETAINIGLSCQLLNDSMKVMVLNAPDIESFAQQLAMIRADLRSRGMWTPGMVQPQLGLVIQGHSLAHVLKAESKKDTSTQPSGGYMKTLRMRFSQLCTCFTGH